jgi:hypothetical protein
MESFKGRFPGRLASIVGKWQGFDEISKHIGDIQSLRKTGGGARDVSI